MSRPEREADAPVLQEDAGGRLDEIGAPSRRVRLDEDSAPSGTVNGAQCHRPTTAVNLGPEHGGPGWIDGGATRRQPAGIQERLAVGAVVEHGGAVVSSLTAGFDQQVGPLRIIRVGGGG